MNKSLQVFFWIVVILFVLIHLFTISYNPLPWFDEAHFASIALDFKTNHTFVPLVDQYARGERESLTYGPLYFIFTSTSMWLGGVNIFSFRIVTFLSGLGCAYVMYRIIRHITGSIVIGGITVVLFLFDPFVNMSMHEGRMDLMALFFVLLSFYLLLKEDKNLYIILSSISATAALLTTPRSVVILAAVGLFFLIRFARSKSPLRLLLLWALPLVLLYAIWVFYAFGGPGGYIEYYQAFQSDPNLVNTEFVGGRFYIPKHEYVLIITAMAFFAINLIRSGFSYFKPIIFVCLAGIGLFYLIVLDWGPYSVLIIPFYYILIFSEQKEEDYSITNLSIYILVILLFFNAGFFFMKNLQVISELEKRDFRKADDFVANNIPAGSKVVADSKFFYSVIKNGSELQLIDKFSTLERREKIHREEWNYDYLIVSQDLKEGDPETVLKYLENSRLRKIAELKIPRSELSKRISSLKILSGTENSGYDAVIFARIKDHKALPMASESGKRRAVNGKLVSLKF